MHLQVKDIWVFKRTCSHVHHMVRFSINALDGLHGHMRIVGGPPEQKGAPVYGLNLLGHQRVPPDKVEHVVGQGGGRVNAPGSQVVSDALRTNGIREL